MFAQSGATASQGLAGIARILASFVTPVGIAVAGFAAMAASVYSFVSFSGEISDFSKRLGISAQQAEVLYKNIYKLTGLDVSEQRKEFTNLGSILNKTARDPNVDDNDVSKLFTQNGLSILDANGKLKDFNTNLKQAVTLVQNAKTEFDAIDVGKLLGFSEEFTTSLYRAKTGLDDINKAGGTALDPLKQSAADFDKNASEYWRNFVLYAKSAIQEVGRFLYNLFDNLPKDPIGTLVTKAIGAAKAAPGAIGGAIGEMNSQSYGPISVVDRIGGNSRKVAAQNFQDRFNGGAIDPNLIEGVLAAGLKAKVDKMNGVVAKTVLPTGKPTVIPAPDKKEVKTPKPKFDVEEDINIKLDQQIARLKLLKPEREIQQQLDEVDNKLRRQGKTLNDEERAAIRGKIVEIERLKDVQQVMDQLYTSTVGTQEKYNATLEAGNNLLQKGIINQDQYASAVNAAKIKVLDSQNTLASGFESGLLKSVQAYGDVSGQVSATVGRSFDSLANGLGDFVTGTKFSFADLSKSILQDITKMILRIAVLKPILSSISGGFGDGGIGSIFGNVPGFGGGGLDVLGSNVPGLPKFATGGEFRVGGTGTTDSKVVAFRASPDERVRVTRPGQGEGPNVNVNVINNANGAEARVEKKPDGNGGLSYQVIVDQIESRLAQGVSSGTSPLARGMQQRYGLDPARGAR